MIMCMNISKSVHRLNNKRSEFATIFIGKSKGSNKNNDLIFSKPDDTLLRQLY